VTCSYHEGKSEGKVAVWQVATYRVARQTSAEHNMVAQRKCEGRHKEKERVDRDLQVARKGWLAGGRRRGARHRPSGTWPRRTESAEEVATRTTPSSGHSAAHRGSARANRQVPRHHRPGLGHAAGRQWPAPRPRESGWTNRRGRVLCRGCRAMLGRRPARSVMRASTEQVIGDRRLGEKGSSAGQIGS